MNTEAQPVWRLSARQFLGLSLYAAVVPMVLYLMSGPMPGAKALAIIGFMCTLPFWPLVVVPIQAAAVIGGPVTFFLTAWATTLAQAWVALALLRKRTINKGTEIRTEIIGVIKRSTVLLLLVSLAVVGALFLLSGRP